MSAPWARVVNSTIKKYIRDREVNILRNRKLTALLKLLEFAATLRRLVE